MQQLLDKDADISVQDHNGRTPLHLAALLGHIKTVHTLLNADADINAQNNRLDSPLHVAAQRDHAKTVQILIDAGADINAEDRCFQSLLHRAVNFGHIRAPFRGAKKRCVKTERMVRKRHACRLYGNSRLCRAVTGSPGQLSL